MLMAINNKAAHPPTAIPAICPALRPLDSGGLEVGELVGVLKELDDVEEPLMDAGYKSAGLLSLGSEDRERNGLLFVKWVFSKSANTCGVRFVVYAL